MRFFHFLFLSPFKRADRRGQAHQEFRVPAVLHCARRPVLARPVCGRCARGGRESGQCGGGRGAAERDGGGAGTRVADDDGGC